MKITIDTELVAQLHATLAQFGSDGITGVSRPVYTPAWIATTDCVARWSEAAGLVTRRDAVGNVWGRLEGTEGGKAIVSGSHLDSQLSGGRFDGASGVIAALIGLRTLKRNFGAPKRPLEVLALCEEEGSRFPTANFWGSRAITGAIAADEPERCIGYGGETIAAAMREIGLDPSAIASARRDDIEAFIELHIEQGPILEHEDLPVGVVDAITGSRQYTVTLRGIQNHAGAFPMDLRRDPMAGFAEIAHAATMTAEKVGRPAVTTFGRIEVVPNATAIIPERVTFSLDVRHPDLATAQRLYSTHEATMREVTQRRGLAIEWTVTSDRPPTPSDPDLIEVLLGTAAEQRLPHRVMHSGAMHDAQQMAKIARVAMIFVRSKDGRSHTPEEFSSIDDLVAGTELLTAALYRLAY